MPQISYMVVWNHSAVKNSMYLLHTVEEKRYWSFKTLTETFLCDLADRTDLLD